MIALFFSCAGLPLFWLVFGQKIEIPLPSLGQIRETLILDNNILYQYHDAGDFTNRKSLNLFWQL